MLNCHADPFDKLRTNLSNYDTKTKIYITLREAQVDKRTIYRQALFSVVKLRNITINLKIL